MSVTLSVQTNNTFIYANFLASNMQKVLKNLGIEVNKEFTGKIAFKDLLPCINTLIDLISQIEGKKAQIDDEDEAWLSRYKEVLTVLTTAYTFGKDVIYA